MTDEQPRLRIDKWLWHARLCKTRGLAARLCEAEAVELDGNLVRRPAQPVRLGQAVTLRHGGTERRLEILGLGTRRGPAAEARLLYRETAPPRRLERGTGEWQPLLIDDDEDADEPL